MGVTKALVRRALVISVSAAPYVPIPGLLGVAKMLLIIWDAVQVVDVRVRLSHFCFASCDRDNPKMNRLACMRLARRCADIVLCVRQEVKEAGDVIRSELFMPLSRLVESVSFFLSKRSNLTCQS